VSTYRWLKAAASSLRSVAKPLTRALAVLFFFALAPIVAYTAPPAQRTTVFVATTISIVIAALGWFGYRYLAPRVGKLTATAAVALFFGILSGTLSALSPHCLGTSSACTTKQLAAQSLIGLLLPVIPALAVFPLRALWRTWVALFRRIRRTSPTETVAAPPRSQLNRKSHQKSARLKNKPQR